MRIIGKHLKQQQQQHCPGRRRCSCSKLEFFIETIRSILMVDTFCVIAEFRVGVSNNVNVYTHIFSAAKRHPGALLLVLLLSHRQ